MLFLSQLNLHAFAKLLWYPLALSVGGIALGMIFVSAWRERHTEYQLLTISGLAIIPYAAHDLLLVNGVLPWEEGYYFQFAAVLLLGMFTLIILYRLVTSSNEVEELNRDLESRVEQKTRQLAESLERNRELQKAEWLNTERTRISRDMHDGVAGQILSTISSLQQGRVSQSDILEGLRYCISDIRLMIDSLDNEDNDLVTLLGMFRYRIAKVVAQANIELTGSPLPRRDSVTLEPSDALNLLRIMQEAITNAIRHACCSCLTIITERVAKSENQIRITIRDNGIGNSSKSVGQEFATPGRGLKNMRFRAQQIGASLTIESSRDGTLIILLLETKPQTK
jgi:signal transduction histidine kinase